MRRAFIFLSFCGLTMFLGSCEKLDSKLLFGSWEGVSVLEEGNPLEVDPKEILFYFDENESYRYNSTLKYKEAGSYYLEANLLFTTDTVNQASTEKAVEILLLSKDSLHLKMDEGGKERILKLVKK